LLRVRFAFDGVTLDATLRETPTAEAIHAILPVEAEIAVRDGEVVFAVPVSVAREPGAGHVLKAGQIAYRPEARSIAIGLASTPASAEGEAHHEEPFNLWADASGDLTGLAVLTPGTRVLVTWA